MANIPLSSAETNRRRSVTGPIRDLVWNYPTHGRPDEPGAEAVLKEINGFTMADGKPVEGFTSLKDDCSTACGAWIYSDVYKDGINMAARRKPYWEQNYICSGVGLGVPHNRRICTNRVSAGHGGDGRWKCPVSTERWLPAMTKLYGNSIEPVFTDGRDIDPDVGQLIVEAAQQISDGSADQHEKKMSGVWQSLLERNTEDPTYYDRPMLQESVWSWAIPLYFSSSDFPGLLCLWQQQPPSENRRVLMTSFTMLTCGSCGTSLVAAF